MVEERPAAAGERPVQRAENGQRVTRPLVARTLLAEVKLTLVLLDENGEPQGPFNAQAVTLSRQDPEGRGRDLDEQFRDLRAKAEAQVVEQWRKRNAAG